MASIHMWHMWVGAQKSSRDLHGQCLLLHIVVECGFHVRGHGPTEAVHGMSGALSGLVEFAL